MLKFALRRPIDPPPHWGASAVVRLDGFPKESTPIFSYSFSRPHWQRAWGIFWRLVHEHSGGTCELQISPSGQIATAFHNIITPWCAPLKLGKAYEVSGGWDGITLNCLVISLEDGARESRYCPLDHVPPLSIYESRFPGVIKEVAIYAKPISR